jgi:hypothetical protein
MLGFRSANDSEANDRRTLINSIVGIVISLGMMVSSIIVLASEWSADCAQPLRTVVACWLAMWVLTLMSNTVDLCSVTTSSPHQMSTTRAVLNILVLFGMIGMLIFSSIQYYHVRNRPCSATLYGYHMFLWIWQLVGACIAALYLIVFCCAVCLVGGCF